MMADRSPILDYATANPVPAYIVPVITVPSASLLLNESGVAIQTETSIDIEINQLATS